MTTNPPQKTIVIIGGGIIGSTTAYYLTRHAAYNPALHKIHLIEATAIASGASGKAGGLLALWAYPSCLVPLSFKLHAELAREHGGAERWGYRGVGVGSIDLVGRKVDGEGKGGSVNGGKGHGEDTRGLHRPDVSSDGNVDVNARVSLQKRSKESYARLRKAGLPDDLDWVADETVRAYESMGSPEDTAQVHPYQFTTSMVQLAEEKGLNVILGSATEIIDDACHSSEGGTHTHTVKYTDKATGTARELSATDVIVTAGPWTSTILPSAPIGSLRAHSVTIKPTRPVSAYCLFTSISLPKNFKTGSPSRAMTVTPEIYARPKGEIYACGEGDHLAPLPASTAEVAVDDARCQDIIDYCASFSDEIRDGDVTVRQACYLPQVEGAVAGPLVGRTKRDGVFLAAGHTCWGIQNGPATGMLMSEFVFDGEARSARVAGLDPKRAGC
ncbi:hypothetical protein LTR84_008125 [Exophiala bonariae]|uniref:FAD dependent oxidoreductase domain-containing protein n=1 Tax=Exophiala bonariae TaxID=1690606 RepID=A0AAV9NM03_9EURO|nr:hypothetical protein LTR84_008125 [Exophiala bonariae]